MGDRLLAHPAVLTLPAMQSGVMTLAPEQSARRWQAETAGKVAFWATALFAAQLYLSPAQWFPVLEPLHHAAILSALGLAALMVRRVLTNRPLWMGWRTALLTVYVGAAVLSPTWSISPADSKAGAL